MKRVETHHYCTKALGVSVSVILCACNAMTRLYLWNTRVHCTSLHHIISYRIISYHVVFLYIMCCRTFCAIAEYFFGPWTLVVFNRCRFRRAVCSSLCTMNKTLDDTNTLRNLVDSDKCDGLQSMDSPPSHAKVVPGWLLISPTSPMLSQADDLPDVHSSPEACKNQTSRKESSSPPFTSESKERMQMKVTAQSEHASSTNLHVSSDISTTPTSKAKTIATTYTMTAMECSIKSQDVCDIDTNTTDSEMTSAASSSRSKGSQTLRAEAILETPKKHMLKSKSGSKRTKLAVKVNFLVD